MEEQDKMTEILPSEEDVDVIENLDIGKSPGRFQNIVDLQLKKKREESTMTDLKSWLR